MINLGIIGMSEGNGHPYSWAAIINGYDKESMSQCPFPVIPEYLGKQIYPEDFIRGGCVTHIWTQELDISRHIAQASKIPNIVDRYEDMIGHVDAVLLARDDYQNHAFFSTPFLKAGLPVYIDKPLANTAESAQSLLDMRQYETQIFTCSALRYARELEPFKERSGDIISITAHTPKSWSLYGIHIIEPVVSLLGIEVPVEGGNSSVEGEKVIVEARFEGVRLRFESSGETKGTINFKIDYRNGKTHSVVISDMFYAFRAALEAFLTQVKTKTHAISQDQTMACMRLIEMGKEVS